MDGRVKNDKITRKTLENETMATEEDTDGTSRLLRRIRIEV